MSATTELTTATEDAAIKQLHPTLFIALGGTGKEVALRLRRRILQTEWNGERISRVSDFPLAAFLYFDLDQATAAETGRSLEDDPLAAAIAFDQAETMQQKFDVPSIVNNLARHRLIREWWPEADVKSIDVTKGAGQVRALSRMAFFLHSAELRSRVRAKSVELLQNVSNEAKLRRLGLETSNRLNVVVIASAAGGTGSGTFIDVGLMLRSEHDTPPDAVELYLVLPGGFTGANAGRVQANSYAALMELELTMRPNSNPPYAERWNDRDTASTGTPYDDVYMLDTRNIVNESTGDVTDLYSMIADVLFEDYGAIELADKKRSIAVNQRNWKSSLYYPDLPDEVGGSVLGYSRGYSSLGQATLDSFGQINLDIDERRAMRGMIDAYFGVGDAVTPANAPNTQQRDRFLRERLSLGPATFNRFPKDEPVPTITEFGIVDELLLRADNSQIDRDLEARVDAEISEILQGYPKPSDWADRLSAYRDGLRGDVESSAAQRGGPPINLEINDSRRRIMERWRSPAGLRGSLYAMIDNKDVGGLDYTISLIELVRDSITSGGTSIVDQLRKAQDAYGRLATTMLNDRFDRQLDNLREAAKPSFWSPKRALCDIYAENARTDLKFFMVYRARARACQEAREALNDLLLYLGERRSMTEGGLETGTGLIAEFLQGRNDIRTARAAINFEIKMLNDGAARRDGMYMVIDRDRVRQKLEFDDAQLRNWANQDFDPHGGSAKLFPLLRQPGGRLQVLNGLQQAARRHLSHVADTVPSLVEVLTTMSGGERHRIFQDLLKRAMPWLHASTAPMKTQFNRDQYKLFVAVRNYVDFKRLFGADFASCLPPLVSSQREAVNFVEAPVPGRMVVLCVLTGIPLDVITPLKTWRVSYNQMSKPGQSLPLHNHRDVARFPHPVVPDDTELRTLRDRMKLLLRAVLFGIATRTSDQATGRDASNLDQYVVELQAGYRVNVGSERVLRATPFVPVHGETIEKAVKKFEDQLQSIQLLAAAALCRYTAQRVYAKKPVKTTGGQDDSRAGLMHVVALELEQRYRAMFDRRKGDAEILAPDSMVGQLFEKIGQWTDEIEGSIGDADPVEVNVDPEDLLNGALPKRKINKLAFDAEQLRRAFLHGGSSSPLMSPPPLSTAGSPGPSFHVEMRGTDGGRQSWSELRRMVSEGQLTPETRVWNETMTAWTPAAAVPALAPLLAGLTRALPPPAPPVLPQTS